ncbi:MAG: hypothetical protein IT160_19905 [Bryobacterales bacterium]|nr:hypothetical protein [Bryobacterales bacterium]
MNFGRRTLLQFAGGSAAGALFTPIPWRLLWDSAVWTQNWSWIPKLPRGEVTEKFSTCTLCPAACPVKARCVGNQPVSLTGVAATAESNGALCPVGLAGHHLPYHPKRAVLPFRRRSVNGKVAVSPLSADEAAAAIAERLNALPAGQSTVILDERPGRVTSRIYQTLAAKLPRGEYVTSPQTEGGTLAKLESLTGTPAAMNMAGADLVVSFGTPLLDGWGTPGRVFAARDRFRLIQVEPLLSRTAAAADLWIPVYPGTEAALALGLLNLLTGAASGWTPEKVQSVSGVPAESVARIAAELKAAKAALVIADGDPGGGAFSPDEQSLFAALNLAVDSAVHPCGVPRVTRPIEALPDASIGVLLCDAASSGAGTPWRVIARKLAPAAMVVSLSPFLEGYGRHAELIVPAPAYLESLQEVPTAPDAPAAGFALAPPLIPARPGATEPAEFIARLAGEPVTLSVELKKHVEALHATGKGEVVRYAGGEVTPVKDFKTSDELWNALNQGACWRQGLPAGMYASKPSARLLQAAVQSAERRLAAGGQTDPARPLMLITTAWRATAGNAQVSPLLTKLYQESELREPGNSAAIHPDTSQKLNLKHGGQAILTTACGSCPVAIVVDAGVMPGVVSAVIGPTVDSIGAAPRNGGSTIGDICAPDGDAPWRVTSAQLRRA